MGAEESHGYLKLNKASKGSSIEYLRTERMGTWSKLPYSNRAPLTRTGYFKAYDDKRDFIYVGYGVTAEDKLLSDVWQFDIKHSQWKKLKLTGAVQTPRSGARAAYYKSNVYIFGGFAEHHYYSDLHKINLETGEVTMIDTTGDVPPARTTPVFEIYNNKAYVWGGFNGAWPVDLHVLDLDTLVWSKYDMLVEGRTRSPHIVVGNMLMIYAGAKSTDMLTINLDTYEYSTQPTTGTNPWCMFNSEMTLIDQDHAVYLGCCQKRSSPLYVIDLKTMKWSVMNVIPDGVTTKVNDGRLLKSGLFVIPRFESCLMHYNQEKRAVMILHPEDSKNMDIMYLNEEISKLEMDGIEMLDSAGSADSI